MKRRVIKLNGNEVIEVEKKKYLVFALQKNDGFTKDVKYRIKCRWKK